MAPNIYYCMVRKYVSGTSCGHIHMLTSCLPYGQSYTAALMQYNYHPSSGKWVQLACNYSEKVIAWCRLVIWLFSVCTIVNNNRGNIFV